MSENITQIIKDTTSNPAPIGLLGFGMTTVLLNIHNAGFMQLDTVIVALGVFYGGLAQFIAGVMEWKKGNTFASTAFVSYGTFWWTFLAVLIFLPKAGIHAVSAVTLTWYLVLWTIFTLGMFIATLKLSKSLQLIFLTLTILFLFLDIHVATGSELFEHLAGYIGIICGALAMYTGLAEVINEVHGNKVFPL